MNIKFIDFKALINDNILFKLDSDFKKFEINSLKLKRKFLIYRICCEILSLINTNLNKKIIFYIYNCNEYKLDFCDKGSIERIFNKVSSSLKLNTFKYKLEFTDLEKMLLQNTGESKELRIRIDNILSKNNKNISLESFYKYLAKNQIYKIKDVLDNNNVKLGIFIT